MVKIIKKGKKVELQ